MRADAARNRSRILAAATEVFAAQGPSASTEEVAARAGVAIGTVFRHFPTKNDLLAAIMKDLLDTLVAEIGALTAAPPTVSPTRANDPAASAPGNDPHPGGGRASGTGATPSTTGKPLLFVFFERLVAQAASRKAVVDLLAAGGTEIRLPDTLQVFEDAVGRLLRQGQTAGTVSRDVALPEVMALLTSTSQGAVQGGWSPKLQERVLAVVLAGLSP